MSVVPFGASRESGKSDRLIVFTLAQRATPGTVFTHADLREALQEGIDAEIPMARVYAAVSNANTSLLREERRFLAPVRGQGYRVLRGDEHMGAALAKRDTARTHMKRGVQLLQQVRADELSEAERKLYEGVGMVWAGVLHAMSESERRHDRQEDLLDELRGRVERLESPRATDGI